MFSTTYKRLFEVRVLHDFYLSENDSGTSFFGLTTAQQQVRLMSLLERGQYNAGQDLQVVPDEATANLFRNQKMKCLPTLLGCVVVLEVKREENGGTFFRPAVPLAADARMSFKMVGKNGAFANFTNLPVWDSLPAQFFFENENARTAGTAKVLARPAKIYDPTEEHLMGDLVESSGAIKEIYYRVQDNAQAFLDVDGDGFVTVEDKALLPKKFEYRFLGLSNGTALFTLSAAGGGAVVKTIGRSPANPFRRVSLDFSKTAGANPQSIADGRYIIKVELNGSTVEEREVLLSDQHFSTQQMGVLEFRPKATDPQFSLLDGNGRLFTHIQPDGTKVPHPVFELRFLSRRTFWRYHRAAGFGAGDTGISNDLVLVDDRLVSKLPKALTRGLQPFAAASGRNMPNPRPGLLKVEDRKLINDIQVTSVNRLG